MDFQSAARFGERRVMVTNYDETAVKVNAKVVNEDTGEVICESGGGGGGGLPLATANVTVYNNDSSSIVAATSLPLSQDFNGVCNYITCGPNTSYTAKIVIPEGGRTMFGTFASEYTIESGDAVKNNNMLTISGDCVIRVTKAGEPE